jgi:hypothetical protein
MYGMSWGQLGVLATPYYLSIGLVLDFKAGTTVARLPRLAPRASNSIGSGD